MVMAYVIAFISGDIAKVVPKKIIAITAQIAGILRYIWETDVQKRTFGVPIANIKGL